MDALEKTMKTAERGEIKSISITSVTTSGEILSTYSSESLLEILGAVRCTEDDLLDELKI